MKRSLLYGLILVLGLAGLAVAQGPSPGGAFVPTFNYIVSGQWTWNRLTPWVIKTNGNSGPGTFTSSVVVTQPTANVNIRMVVGGAGTIGTNPSSIVTGLSALRACWISPRMTTGPYLVSSPPFFWTTQLTAVAGRLDVYHWTTTGASTAGVEFTWGCIGS